MLDDDDGFDPLAPRMTGDFDTATTALTRLLHKLNGLRGNKDGIIEELGYVEAGIKQAEARRKAAELTVARMQRDLDEARGKGDALAAAVKRLESVERELETERKKRAALAQAAAPAPQLPELLVAIFDNPVRLGVLAVAALGFIAVVAAVVALGLGGDDDLAVLQETHGQILAKLDEGGRPALKLDPPPAEPTRVEPTPTEPPAVEPSPVEPAPAPPAPPAQTAGASDRFMVVHSSSPSHAEALRVRDRALRYLSKRESGARVCLTTPIDGRMLVFFTTPEGFAKKDAIVWAYRLTTARDSGTTFAFPDRVPAPGQVVDCAPEG
jgi:hypothetical protein